MSGQKYMQPILPQPHSVVGFCLRMISHLCSQRGASLTTYSASQSCIESSLYKLNALAFITQKLYLKGSTHSD